MRLMVICVAVAVSRGRFVVSCLMVASVLAAPAYAVRLAGGLSETTKCGKQRILIDALRDPDVRKLTGPPGRALVNRCGVFPFELHRGGRLVVHGSCFVHVTQYQNYYFIEYRIQRTWLRLPAGNWVIRDAMRQGDGGGSGGLTKQSTRLLDGPGRISVFSALGGNGGSVSPSNRKPLRVPSRIACGVFAGHSLQPPRLF